MKSAPMARADALLYRSEFERTVESESNQRRKAFLEFMMMQSFAAVSEANDGIAPDADVTLDMRGIAALAYRLFEHQKIVLEIFAGDIGEEDWSS